MSPPQSEQLLDLERELERLRRTNRALVAAVGLALILASAALAWHLLPHKNLRTQQVEIIDASGGTRAQLRATSEDEVGLVLLDRGGTVRAALAQRGEHIELTLHQPNGDETIALKTERMPVKGVDATTRLATVSSLQLRGDVPTMTAEISVHPDSGSRVALSHIQNDLRHAAWLSATGGDAGVRAYRGAQKAPNASPRVAAELRVHGDGAISQQSWVEKEGGVLAEVRSTAGSLTEVSAREVVESKLLARSITLGPGAGHPRTDPPMLRLSHRQGRDPSNANVVLLDTGDLDEKGGPRIALDGPHGRMLFGEPIEDLGPGIKIFAEETKDYPIKTIP